MFGVSGGPGEVKSMLEGDLESQDRIHLEGREKGRAGVCALAHDDKTATIFFRQTHRERRLSVSAPRCCH